jgi:transposase
MSRYVATGANGSKISEPAMDVFLQFTSDRRSIELIIEQIKAVEAARATLIAEQAANTPAAMLLNLKGIGAEFAPILTRRQLAAYAGLAPTPWQSGSIRQEQGVS